MGINKSLFEALSGLHKDKHYPPYALKIPSSIKSCSMLWLRWSVLQLRDLAGFEEEDPKHS